MLKKYLLLNLMLVSALGFSQDKKSEIQIPSQLTDSKSLSKAVKNISGSFKDYTIVGLGEGTHGTKEFNEIRSEISKNLIDKNDFKIVAFESAYGDAAFLNDALNSDTDLKEVLKNYITSIWQTKEIENLLGWIRVYNKNHKDKVIISGFDTNSLENSARMLVKSEVKEKQYSEIAEELKKKAVFQDEMWEKQNDPSFKLDMKAVIKNGTEGYMLAKKIDSIYGGKIGRDAELALYNLQLGFEIPYEAGKKNYDVSRDRIMADMIGKIQSAYNKKMILFAHNAHIALKPILVDGMGGYIQKKYRKKYYALGTFTASGTYSATTDPRAVKYNQYNSYPLPKLMENSWEEKLVQKNTGNYFADFQKDNTGFYGKSFKARFVGYGPITPETEKFTITEPLKLNECFDGLIFIKNTHASEHLTGS